MYDPVPPNVNTVWIRPLSVYPEFIGIGTINNFLLEFSFSTAIGNVFLLERYLEVVRSQPIYMR